MHLSLKLRKGDDESVKKHLAERIDESREYNQRKFDSIDKKFDVVDKKIDLVFWRFSGLLTLFSAIIITSFKILIS